MRLTRRGVALLASAAALYAAGEILGFPLLRALGGVGAGAVAFACVVAIRRPRVAVDRDVYPDRVECGRPALALLRVRNPGTARHPGFLATDLLGGRQHEVAIRELPPGATTSHRYELPTQRRGRLTVGPMTLERRDPLDLVRSRVVTGGTATLWVHPRRHPVRTVDIGWPRHHHVGPTSPDPLSGSTDLRQIRPYVPGDEVRHVQWKALARTGQLMVREYADPAQPLFTVVLDDRAGALAPPVFEEAVEVAASLSFAAIMAGHRTRLVGAAGVLDLQATGGLPAAREFLDRLAELEPAAAREGTPAVAGGGAVFVSGGRPAADHRMRAMLSGHGAAVTVVDLDPPAGPPAPGTISARTAAEVIRQWNGAAVQR